MKILSVGGFKGYGKSNTCLHRHWALKKIADQIDIVNTTQDRISLFWRIAHHLFLWGIPIKLPDSTKANKKIIEMANTNVYDVLWIDKGVTIFASTLQEFRKKQPNAKIIGYSPDNMVLRHNQSQQYIESIPFYDYLVTNKSYIIEDLTKLGAKNVIFVNNTFEPSFHHKYDLTLVDKLRLGGDVGFIGMWEKERCKSIVYLATHGIKVRVWGDNRWQAFKNISPNLQIEDKCLFSDDYCKALASFRINLCFLRKMNFDQQTTRTVEIPACGGFMLAERTKEHLNLFEEGKEAAFFSSNEELLEMCQYYLDHENERRQIAEAGYQRCLTSDYSNEGMIRKVFKQIRII